MLLEGALAEGLELHAHDVAFRRLVRLDPKSFFRASGGGGGSWSCQERIMACGAKKQAM